MPVLESATKQDIARLLELFPIARLKDAFSEFSGTKEEISRSAADASDLGRITKFLGDNFARCKLHTFVFEKPENEADFLVAIPGAEAVAFPNAATSITLCRLKYKVLFREPPYEDEEIEFLWPMRIVVRKGMLILSFVVFERSVSSFFSRQCSILTRSVEEKAVVAGFRSLGAIPCDLHKGIKALWNTDFMDAFKVKYKEPFAIVSKEMDEEAGIKAKNPEFFKELQTYTLYSTMFKISPNAECSVKLFHTDPSSGSISFPRYTDGEGDSDAVVFKIMDENS